MPDYRKAAERAAKKYGVDPKIFLAMIQQESGFNPNARSGAGAQGIAQFMPATAKGYGVNLNDGRVRDDLEGAAKYIRENLQRTGGNYHQALSIYNSGRPDAYKDQGFAGGQTYNYVRTILGSAGGQKVSGRGGASPGTKTTTTTTPGVDNSAARRDLIVQYLAARHNPDALIALAAGLQGAKDTPASTSTKTTRNRASSGTGAAGKSQGRSPLKELFWQGQGGVNVKNNVKVPQGFVSGHTDHVHVAAGPRTVIELGKLAQSMGLRVGENPYFTGQDAAPGVHSGTSNHYKIKFVGGKKVGEAIDVSGDPRKMAHYAAVVAHQYGLKVKG